MKKKYCAPEILIVIYEIESIFTASVVVGDPYQPGEEEIDGPSLFE